MQTNWSAGKWLSRMATCSILLIAIVLTFGEKAHSQLLEFGQDTWDDYFLLRGAGVIQQPTSDRNPDIDSQIAKVIKKKQPAPLKTITLRPRHNC